jgi:hypothetical protein
MKTSTIEVGELVSTLSVADLARQLSTLPGVYSADVNYVARSATVYMTNHELTLKPSGNAWSTAVTTAALNSCQPMSRLSRFESWL